MHKSDFNIKVHVYPTPGVIKKGEIKTKGALQQNTKTRQAWILAWVLEIWVYANFQRISLLWLFGVLHCLIRGLSF